MNGPSDHLSYRSMWNLLRSKYTIFVSGDRVMSVLKVIYPNATEQRKSCRLKRLKYLVKGTNNIWHADGLDKLNPYGLPIHAIIDGFPHKVL